MEKLQSKKSINLLMYICAAVYFASYVTRFGIIATISEVIESGMASQQVASLAETLNLLCYGAGQIISGILGDRIKPQRLIFIGLLVTFLVNLSVGVGAQGNLLVFLWPINGFAQAFMWPPMVAILSRYLDELNYNKAIVKVTFGSSAATVLMYLLCPLIIKTIGLKFVFLFAALVGVTVAFLWHFVYNANFTTAAAPVQANDQNTKAQKPKSASLGLSVIALLGLILVAVVFQGMLRDGVQTWTPSILISMHGLDTSSAILSSVILPIFGFLCIALSTFVQTKLIKNESLAAGVFFAAATLSAVLFRYFGKANVIVSVVLCAIIIGCGHAINVFLVCIIPRSFARMGRVGFVTGFLNSGTYVGSALAVYIFSALGENGDWNNVIILWAIIAFAGVAICFAFAKWWENFKRTQQ